MDTSTKALNYFGELLITKVRDETITDWHMIINGEMKDPESKKIFNDLSIFNNEQKEYIKYLINKVVDTSLHHMLWTFEQNETVDISINIDNTYIKSIRNISDGLSGELYSEDGWIAKFSSQFYEL